MQDTDEYLEATGAIKSCVDGEDVDSQESAIATRRNVLLMFVYEINNHNLIVYLVFEFYLKLLVALMLIRLVYSVKL